MGFKTQLFDLKFLLSYKNMLGKILLQQYDNQLFPYI